VISRYFHLLIHASQLQYTGAGLEDLMPLAGSQPKAAPPDLTFFSAR
jgi:hypothetical protein